MQTQPGSPRPPGKGSPSREASDAEDRALVARVADGDSAAFEALYRRFARRVGGYLFRMLGRPELVDEALDDVMLVVWQKADTFDSRSRVSTWLFGIAHNKGLKTLERHRRSERELSREDEEPGMTHSDPAAGPEELATVRDEMQQLKRGLATLSEDQRSVVELTFFAGQSYQEIAEVLGCPVNTVKTRMFHARKALNRFLRGGGPEDETHLGGSHANA